MISAAFTPTGQLLVSVLDLKTQKISVWDVAARREIWKAPVEAVASAGSFGTLSPDGKLLAAVPLLETAGRREPLTIWELPLGRKLTQLEPGADGAGYPRFSPDGRWLVTLDHSNNFASILFGRMGGHSGLTAGTQVVVQGLAPGAGRFKISGIAAPDTYAISPDSRQLAIGYRDGTIQVWDLHSAAELFRYAPGPLSVSHLAFTPDGAGLASCNEQSPSIQLLHLADLRRQLTRMGLDQPDK
jgi:WD40 repeat protein